jgi:hypothetical protein
MIRVLPAALLAACNYDADPDGEYVPPVSRGDSPEIVSGYVCAPSGMTLPYAYVYIPIDEDDDGVEDFRYETTSGDDGSFEFEDLPAGHYTVHVVKGSYDIVSEFDYTGEDRLNVGGMCIDVGDLSLAVVQGDWDSIQEILDYLGFPYTLYTADQAAGLLSDPVNLAKYDAVFLNCGSVYDSLLATTPTAAPSLRAYAEAGGKVYASDWAYSMIEHAFPEMVHFHGEDDELGNPKVGNVGTVHGKVLDPALESVMGSEVEIYYQLGAWVVVDGVGTGSSVVVQGSPSTSSGTLDGVPLTIRAPQGKGSALYTTFHNEAQATADAKQILFEFVLNL